MSQEDLREWFSAQWECYSPSAQGYSTPLDRKLFESTFVQQGYAASHIGAPPESSLVSPQRKCNEFHLVVCTLLC